MSDTKGKNRSSLRWAAAVSAVLILSAWVCLRHLRDAPVRAVPGLGAAAPSAERRTAGELRRRVLSRTSAPPATNSAAPFAALLGAGATNYVGGMAALQALPAVISSNQFETLRAVVAAVYSPAMALSPLEFNGVKNAPADILLQQPDFPADLLADFALQHADPAQDEVWRDYSLQMLASGYLNLAGRGRAGPDVPAARELALDTLMSAASAGGGTWPGTALLGLNTILDSEPGAFPRDELDSRILAVLADASASEPSLITAVRLAGMSGIPSARASLERLASSSPSELVRAAAARSLTELPAPSEPSAKPARVTRLSNNAIRQ